MRAIVVKKNAGLSGLTLIEKELPQPAADQVVVQWHATSINYHDYLVATGGIPVDEGRVPMSDGAGEIIAVGKEVSEWQVGDKVMSTFFPLWLEGRANAQNTKAIHGDTVDGFAQEQSAVTATALTAMPKGYSYAEAATLPCAAATAWRALVVEGGLKAGDKVLIEGSGGMSIFGLQIARAAGATVYATTSSEEKKAKLKALGADYVINYRQDEKWGETVAKLSGGGVEHVLAVGGGSTLTQSIEAAAYNGNIALIGVLGGRKAEIVMPKLFFKHLHLNGIAVGSRAMQQALVASINKAGWKPVIDKTFSLEELADAFNYQETGEHFGKIVVEF